MSADNALVVLVTTDEIMFIGDMKIPQPEGRTVYRVAEVQASENFEWFHENEPERLPEYMKNIWGRSPVFYDKELAWKYVRAKETEIFENEGILEYGSFQIDAEDLCFPGTELKGEKKKELWIILNSIGSQIGNGLFTSQEKAETYIQTYFDQDIMTTDLFIHQIKLEPAANVFEAKSIKKETS